MFYSQEAGASAVGVRVEQLVPQTVLKSGVVSRETGRGAVPSSRKVLGESKEGLCSDH